MPLPLSELFISWMLPECFSLRVLISIKSTMIIDGGHHGIRLYEREVQPQNFFRALILLNSTISPLRFLPDGEILIEPVQITNDADGFQLLVSKLESFDKNSIIIGLESTAHYGDNLVRYLVAEFYQVIGVLNPIKPVRCVRTMFVKQRQIRSTHLLLLKLL